MSKAWTKESIVAVLDSSDIFLERAILRMYDRQTFDEQTSKQTRHENGRGFNGPDARKMSSLAQWLRKAKAPEGKRMNAGMREDARKRLRKYAGQLLEMAQDKTEQAAHAK